MSAIVFCGPSLSQKAARAIFPEAEHLGPAGRGDVLAAARSRPRVICLIDGVFEHRPAVMHKEILWALSEGISVFGASSMGALRAAELAAFGMVGWGVIYERFACGELEDDDEVAVAHAGAEHDYKVGSDALVNLRATLARAAGKGVVSAATCAGLLTCAKATFYPERSCDVILSNAARAGVPRRELEALSAWLGTRSNWVDQKRLDAEALLRHVRKQLLAGELRSSRPSWDFPHTAAWQELVVATPAMSGCAEPNHAAEEKCEAVQLEELTLMAEEIQLLGPEVFADVMLSATSRALAISLVMLGQAQRTALDFAGSDADHQDALVREGASDGRTAVLAQLPHVLKQQGDAAKVLERARRKQAIWGSEGAARLASDREMLVWYFERRLKCAVPADLTAYAETIGMSSRAQLLRAIAREFVFMHRSAIAR